MNLQNRIWMTLWLEHFFQHATVVEELPFGWCVYREAVDWD